MVFFFNSAITSDFSGGSAISSMLAKASVAQAISEQQNSSPSPTTILKSINSGNYICSSTRSNQIDMPSPTVIYHESSSKTTVLMQTQQQNMIQHRNALNNMCQKDQYDYENDDSSSQQQQFQQYHNSYNYSQTQHTTISESQQQVDQQTIEARMNNLGNEHHDTG